MFETRRPGRPIIRDEKRGRARVGFVSRTRSPQARCFAKLRLVFLGSTPRGWARQAPPCPRSPPPQQVRPDRSPAGPPRPLPSRPAPATSPAGPYPPAPQQVRPRRPGAPRSTENWRGARGGPRMPPMTVLRRIAEWRRGGTAPDAAAIDPTLPATAQVVAIQHPTAEVPER